MTRQRTNVPATSGPRPKKIADKSADSLLFTLAVSMLVVTVLAAILIVQPSTALMVATFAALVVLVSVVGIFLVRFIDAEH